MKTGVGSAIVILVEFVVGILLLVNPTGFTDRIIMAAGIVLLAMSVFWCISYFREPIQVGMETKNLAKSLMGLMAGIFCVARHDLIISVFPILSVMYGVFLLVHSLYEIQTTIDMARLKLKTWKMSAVFSALTFLLAMLILFNPFGTVIAIWTLVGISYIATAVMNLMILVVPGGRVRG